jgi:carboxyl-terminal processing protease
MRQANFEHFTRFNRSRSDYPVVVLINEASASASEIFAGSMQDWDRGLVVGRPSFGKGSVQQLFPLDEGYGMKVTISKYYIKSGRCIHKDLLDRLLRGHDISEEEVEAIERESREKIYHTVNGREVRGGGGIVPDIDLPQTVLTRMERDIRRMNLLQDFSIDYFTKNKDNIETNFVAYQSLIDDFLEFGISRGLEFEPADLDSSHTFIRLSLTKDIIDKKFGEVEGYRAAIALDSQLVEAISLFDHFTTTEEMFQYALRRKERE